MPEPWRVKMIEPIRLISPAERRAALARAGYNLFGIHAEDVFIDLLTDSGTSAMSDAQWAALMRGDESYAGARSFFTFQAAVREIFGFKHVIPTHQGRMGEWLLFSALVRPGQAVPNNAHFDTTRANVEMAGGEAIDLPIAAARVPGVEHPFKGNVDLDALARLVEKRGKRGIPLAILTLTNNSSGGQPVSLENVRTAAAIVHTAGIPLFIDACRFAENAWFVKEREEGQSGRSIRDIVAETFRLADGCIMSAKKDGLANIGGFLALNDDGLCEELKAREVLVEGFPTYGGLAGRDLEAVACGLREVLDERYLAFRTGQVRRFGEAIAAAGVPVIRPIGGHAVYLDAGALLPHLAPEELPAQALAVALYEQGAVRGVEIGSLMFGREGGGPGARPLLELVRLAVPRRVYTESHLDYVVETVAEVARRAPALGGYAIVSAPKVLRHFTARLRPLAREGGAPPPA